MEIISLHQLDWASCRQEKPADEKELKVLTFRYPMNLAPKYWNRVNKRIIDAKQLSVIMRLSYIYPIISLGKLLNNFEALLTKQIVEKFSCSPLGSAIGSVIHLANSAKRNPSMCVCTVQVETVGVARIASVKFEFAASLPIDSNWLVLLYLFAYCKADLQRNNPRIFVIDSKFSFCWWIKI